MLATSDFSHLNSTPTVLLVDIKSFILTTKLKEDIIPFPLLTLFDDLAMDFSIISLFEKVEEELSLLDKIKTTFSKKKETVKMESYGAELHERLEDWIVLAKEYSSPIVMFEKASSSLVDSVIPFKSRVILNNPSAKEARLLLNNYYLKNFPANSGLKKLNPKDAYASKVFEQGKRSTFGDKFNL